MRSTLKSTVYIAQVLAGLAAIGAIFADGQVTRLRLYLATIAALAMVASLFVTAHAEAESQRTRQYLETLVLSMELRYPVIEEMSAIIKRIAEKHDWRWDKQENFEKETVYSFQKMGGPAKGRLVVSDSEFKSLLILEKDEQVRKIEERLFGAPNRNLKEAVARDDEYLSEGIRQAVFEDAEGPLWIGLQNQPDGTWVFSLRENQGDAGRPFLQITSKRRDELRAMVPIERYEAAAEEAKAARRALSK